MATNGQEEIEKILNGLEKIFSNEEEFDVVLMSFNLHIAHVRKQWPSLFKALSSVPIGNQATSDSESVARELLATMKSLGYMGPNEALLRPSTPLQIQELEIVGPEPIFAYTPWVTDHIKSRAVSAFKESDEWLVKWDIPNVPPPRVGEPLTIKNSEGYRLRFQVSEAIDNGDLDGTMVYRFTFLTIVKE